MVIKRSKFPRHSLEGKCRRGQIVMVKDDSFQIRFNAREMIFLNKEDSKFYEKPYIKGGVICIYLNNKKVIDKVYSLGGKLIFEKKL